MVLRTTIPLNTATNVRLVEDVPLSVNATFVLPGGGGSINGNVILSLPSGTELPVALDLNVPVSQTVPVVMDVPVQIELSQTELGVPFDKLQGLFTPLDALVGNLPESNEEFFQRTTDAVVGSSPD
jgi:hypothetical protein